MGYRQHLEGTTLYIDDFGQESGINLTDYCSRHPEITSIIVLCPVPGSLTKIKAHVARDITISFNHSKPSTCSVEINNTTRSQSSAPVVSLALKRNADEINKPSLAPITKTRKIDSAASSSFNLQNKRPLDLYEQEGNKKFATGLLPPPFPTNNLPKPPALVLTSANRSSVSISTSSSVTNRPIPKAYVWTPPPIASISVSSQTSAPVDYQNASTSNRTTSNTSTSTNYSSQYPLVAINQIVTNEGLLSTMGYTQEEYHELLGKTYPPHLVPLAFRSVVGCLEQMKRNGYTMNGTAARTHQVIGLSEYLDSLSSGVKNALFSYATGSGKTLMFTVLAAAFLKAAQENNAKNKVVILVPMLNLRKQTVASFKKYAPHLKVNVIASSDDLTNELNSKVAKVNILTYHLAFGGREKEGAPDKKVQVQQLLNTASLVVIDEAHSAISHFNNADPLIKDALANVALLGFTATPQFNLSSINRGENDAIRIVGHTQETNPITPFNLVAAIRSGINCPVKNIIVLPKPTDGALNNDPNLESDSANISKLLDTDENNRMAVDILLNGADDTGEPFREQKAIVFCSNIKHTDNLLRVIEGIPNITNIVDPEGKSRTKYAIQLVIKALREGDFFNEEMERLVEKLQKCGEQNYGQRLVAEYKQLLEIERPISLRNKQIISNLLEENTLYAWEHFKVAGLVHSNNKKNNEQELEQYQLGGTRFLLGDKMLIAGFDDPETSVILNINPTASEITALQRAGRGARLDPELATKICKVIDIDWKVKDQKFLFEYLGNNPQTNTPYLILGTISQSATPRRMTVPHQWTQAVTPYTLAYEFGGEIMLNFQTLRKKQRQKEQLDDIKAPKTGIRVVLSTAIDKFNQTLSTLATLNSQLKARVQTAEIKVNSQESQVKIKSSTNTNDVQNTKSSSNPRPKTVKTPVTDNTVRVTRDMKKQMVEGIVKAQEIINTIEDFLDVLDHKRNLDTQTPVSENKKQMKAKGTSIHEISIDRELNKFQRTTLQLSSMVNKLGALIKTNGVKPRVATNTGLISTNSSLTVDHETDDHQQERAALIELIEAINEIDNSSLLSEINLDQLLQVRQRNQEHRQADQQQQPEPVLENNNVPKQPDPPEVTFVSTANVPTQSDLATAVTSSVTVPTNEFEKAFFKHCAGEHYYCSYKLTAADIPYFDLKDTNGLNGFLIACKNHRLDTIFNLLKLKPDLIHSLDNDGNNGALLMVASNYDFKRLSKFFSRLEKRFKNFSLEQFFKHTNTHGENLIAKIPAILYSSSFTDILSWNKQYFINSTIQNRSIFDYALQERRYVLLVSLYKVRPEYSTIPIHGLSSLEFVAKNQSLFSPYDYDSCLEIVLKANPQSRYSTFSDGKSAFFHLACVAPKIALELFDHEQDKFINELIPVIEWRANRRVGTSSERFLDNVCLLEFLERLPHNELANLELANIADLKQHITAKRLSPPTSTTNMTFFNPQVTSGQTSRVSESQQQLPQVATLNVSSAFFAATIQNRDVGNAQTSSLNNDGFLDGFSTSTSN